MTYYIGHVVDVYILKELSSAAKHVIEMAFISVVFSLMYSVSLKKCIDPLKDYYMELKIQMYKIIGYLLT